MVPLQQAQTPKLLVVLVRPGRSKTRRGGIPPFNAGWLKLLGIQIW